jgi:hypothetical protein
MYVKTYTFKTGNSVRSLNASSGSQTIAHGLGRIPSFVRITTNYNGPSSMAGTCIGTYDGTTANYAFSLCYPGNASNAGNNTGYIVYAIDNNNTTPNGQEASITVDATNITLTWTKLNSGLNSAAPFVWEAFG